MRIDRKRAWHLLAPGAAVAVLVAVSLGYRLGAQHAFRRNRAAAQAPEFSRDDHHPLTPNGDSANSANGHATVGAGAAKGLVAMDAAYPIRITWPLDVGPDQPGLTAAENRLCLRARQGVNEIQNPGEGKAFYAFSVPCLESYQTWCRVRWIDDEVGSIACNNSWFAAIDDHPAQVLGDEKPDKGWVWKPGPTATLQAGFHWIRIELREDGTRLDRIVIAPANRNLTPAQLDAAHVEVYVPPTGTRIPAAPNQPLQDVELYALPTDSLAIGAGHRNRIALGASRTTRQDTVFRGRIEILCPSAPGLEVEGNSHVVFTGDEMQTRCVLELVFPPDVPRRVHRVTVRVIEETTDSLVFAQSIRFVKPWVWAFFGPFKAQAPGPRSRGRASRPYQPLPLPCDDTPDMLLQGAELDDLGWTPEPAAPDGHAITWRVISDGSCCEWTGAVDLRRVYGGIGPVSAYAVTWIQAETNLFHRSFTFQADDSGWVWINGARVAEVPLNLPREAHRFWTAAVLRKGHNPIVVKTTQQRRYWGFRLEEIDWHWQGRRGDVITGLSFEAWPAP